VLFRAARERVAALHHRLSQRGYFDLTARIRGEGQFRLVAQDQTLVNVSAGKDRLSTT